MNIGGNVEKHTKSVNGNELKFTLFPDIRRFTGRNGQGCRRQVFATTEVAESTARLLTQHGIEMGTIERCGNCGMLHLAEKPIAKPIAKA